MSIRHVLAVVPVADLDAAIDWYSRLFDAAPTNVPMPGLLAEWRLTENGWVQLTTQAGPAGSGSLNLAVDDFDAHIQAVRDRGIEVGSPVGVNKGVRLAEVHDPDGTTVTFIGDFRELY
jgi:predicted enzyme related to lactoylglutathione lyase